MDSIEIRDEEIDVEEIMRKIRENISKRRESGAYTEEMEDLIDEPLQTAETGVLDIDNLQQAFDYLNRNWDTRADYCISSHRPIIGRFLIKGRQLMHGEVRRYVDVIVGKQIEFNARMVRVVNSLIQGIEDRPKQERAEISREIDDKVGWVKTEIGTEIDDKVKEVVATINENIKNKAWLAYLLERKLGKKLEEELPLTGAEKAMNFFLFEEKFRGAREDIKERQLNFLEYSKGCKNVLDIGCGRGEYLEILKEYGINAKGIDINVDMAKYCQSKGLNVEKADAIEYLDKLVDKSLDSIFLDQVIEHLEAKYLIKLLELCYKKLKFGYYIVIETVNPLSLTSFANFYMDLSHKKPIHPETLKFMVESVGFREVEMNFFSPIPDGYKLKKVEISEIIEEKEREMIEVYNYNIEKLNGILYGYQDYAVIGKK